MKQSQSKRLYALLRDGRPHTTVEILDKVYGTGHSGIARIGARIKDLRDAGHDIAGWKDPNNSAIYVYQLKNAPPPRREVRFEMRNGVMTAVLQ